jgi:cephalosporin hydroxylase
MWGRLPAWRGQPCQQFPSDLLRYAELIFELRPAWVLELGTGSGGTALFLADTLEAAGGGTVITVDTGAGPPSHRRLVFITGDAGDPVITARITAACGTVTGERGIVLIDDDHSSAHVAAELAAYAPLADFLVVEDTIMQYLPGFGDGPHVALAGWLPGHPEFKADEDPDPTQHPGGWLRRITG